MGDIQTFSDYLREYSKNPDLLKSMGKRGQEAVRKHFIDKKAAGIILNEILHQN